MFNFWWLATLVNRLEPHLPALSSQKNEMLVFGLCSTSGDRPGWSMDSNPICHPSVAKKNKMLIFGLCSTSGDQPGWSVDSYFLCHPSPAKKIKCLFLDYVQLLVISRAGQWTQTPSATPLQPKKKNKMLVFGLCSTFDDQPGWSVDSNPLCYPSPAKKIKRLFLDYIQLLMIGQAGRCTRTPSTTPLQAKK